MKLSQRLVAWLMRRTTYHCDQLPPDFIVGGWDDAYLLRWYLVPWSRWCKAWRDRPEIEWTWWQRFVMAWPVAYHHRFMRSDDDRALHDHPWCNVSIVLRGEYVEHTIDAGGIHRRAVRRAGDVVFRRATRAHRVELRTDDNGTPKPCTSLFLTGFRLREWGFHCPQQGWIHWRRFTNPTDRGATGKGCDA